MQVSAATFGQNFTLREKNVSIAKVFFEIRKQTGYDVLLETSKLKTSQKINAEFINVPVKEVIDQIIQGTELEYTIDTKTIFIKQKEKSFFERMIERIKQIDVTGKVVDEDGKPIGGANVVEKGTKNATVTDMQGYFTLRGVNENSIIQISIIGFDAKELRAESNLKEIKMISATSKLDEVQVIAYGTTTQRLSTGNITTIKAEEIGKQPVSNPLMALQGRVSGLFITQTTGLPGSAVTVRIQGQNSLNQSNEPLYVIDGVPFSSTLLPTVGTVLTGGAGGAGSPLNLINPSIIESIEVLKDADATSIYGSMAANGAILITTKKGKAGDSKVNLNLQNGWGKITRKLPLLNTEQYLEMRNEALKNDGLIASSNPAATAPFIYAPDLTLWDTNRYTDWQDELIGGTAQYQDIQLSTSGGNERINYFIGSGYHRETTVFPGDMSDRKINFHFNLNSTSASQKFKIQLSGDYLSDRNNLISTDLTSASVRMSPNAPALYNSDGSLNWSPLPNGNSTWLNPLSTLNKRYIGRSNNLIGNMLTSYQLSSYLRIQASFGYTYTQSDDAITNPLSSIVPENRPNSNRSSNFAKNLSTSWIVEPQLVFAKKLGPGNFEALVGSTLRQINSSGLQLFTNGYNSDEVLQDIKSATSISVLDNIISTYKYNAVFGRLTYNLHNRYIVNLTARRDGSSRFGSNNTAHSFGSIAGAWIFSNESFIEKNIPFISFGKIKASYGTTGNDQIGDYQFMNLYNTYSVQTGYQGGVGIAPDRLPNPYLQWEETKKIQLGLDLGFVKDRIQVNATYFRNRSSNQLTRYALPVFTGFNFIQSNFPAVIQNTGLELSITTANIKKDDFNWSTSFNITMPKNKLISFPNLSTSTYANRYVIGQPVSILKTYNYYGVDPTNGLYQITKADGTLSSSTLNSVADAYFLNDMDPKFYGGLNNTLRYKGLEFSFLFQFVKQTASSSYALGDRPGFFTFSASAGVFGNQPSWLLDRWQKPGDNASYQKYSALYPSNLSTPFNNTNTSNYALSDASFVRLKNASLSWQIPTLWANKMQLQNCRLFIQGQNLATITNYKGLDPETKGIRSLPPLRVFTFGIQAGF